MSNSDEGYIKFKSEWSNTDAVRDEDIININFWRKKLFNLGLIGQYADGTGFGNLSERITGNKFLITGSGSGGKSELNAANYAIVTDYSITKNKLWSDGLTQASSESLSHAAIYEASANIKAVIHVHNHMLWSNLMPTHHSTAKDIQYGTPEMAISLRSIARSNSDSGIIVMKGHADGVICYGKDLNQAFNLILAELDNKLSI